MTRSYSCFKDCDLKALELLAFNLSLETYHLVTGSEI
jgi:hypothetical protein